jgi:hypothetical protein
MQRITFESIGEQNLQNRTYLGNALLRAKQQAENVTNFANVVISNYNTGITSPEQFINDIDRLFDSFDDKNFLGKIINRDAIWGNFSF